MALPDPVPLGVSSRVTVPRAAFEAAGAPPEELLLDDDARIRYLAERLAEAMRRPLTAPGSESVAAAALARFPDVDVLSAFAEKALETLRDGAMHNRTAISPDDAHVAVTFVAWYGTHRELQPERVGRYLGPMWSTASDFVKRGIALAGFLEIDAYLRESASPADPARPLAEVLAIDVEYSYLPGFALGFPKDVPNPLPRAFIVNLDLCTPDELQLLDRLRD